MTMVLKELDLIDRQVGHKHADIDHLDYDFNTSFCFVRNPLSWLESWFKYQSVKNWSDFGDRQHWHPCQPLNGLGSSSFDEFVDNVITHQPHFFGGLFGGYTRLPTQFVGRQENLADDLTEILKTTGVDFDKYAIRKFDRVNTSPDVPIRWNTKLRNRFIELEQGTFLEYGYT